MDEPPNEEKIRSLSKKEVRKRYSSGFLQLAKTETVPLIIDALLDAPPSREFNKSELAVRAGISRSSVQTHMDLLLKYKILTPVGETPRYTLNLDSRVTQLLFELDNVISEVDAGDDPERTDDWQDSVMNYRQEMEAPTEFNTQAPESIEGLTG